MVVKVHHKIGAKSMMLALLDFLCENDLDLDLHDLHFKPIKNEIEYGKKLSNVPIQIIVGLNN